MSQEIKDFKDLIRKAIEGNETVFDVASELSEEGEQSTTLRVGYRQLPPLPIPVNKAPAKARSHTFHSLSEFGEYLKREADKEKCVVLADVEPREIKAVLNESDECDREVIAFEAKTHPLFAVWEALIGKAIPVLEFALHVMQHRNAVIEPDGRELALTFSQIKASKNITKHVGIGPKSLNGVVVEMQIGSEKHETDVDLPESITIDVPLFLDTDPMTVQLDLLVTESGDGRLVVFVTAPQLDEARIRAFEGMVTRLRKDTEMIVGLGAVSHREFDKLELQNASDY